MSHSKGQNCDQKKGGIFQTLDSWHREFDYVTACYLLEPWERRIVKGTLVALSGVMIFSTCYFLPSYTSALIQYLRQ